ncbi:MAG TPA: hypothetical protein VGQ18_07135 [Gemmatimonadales bacterium]|jgi:uncharacterized protein YxjI|nr:hypothetical protein [Gemmatimonadales bacterium]
MSVRVTCQCGTSYELKDEFAGKLVKCPQCGRENRVPAGSAGVPVQVQADPVFDRDIFLLRQQMLRISEKYDVGDEKGNNIIYIERPAHLLRNLGALLAALAAAIVIFVAFGAVADQTPVGSAARGILLLLGSLLAFVALVVVGVALSVKRHVTFYRDASKRDRLIEVLQDKKWQPITATYTVRDFRGKPLAKFAKNILYNLFRKRWYIHAPDGRVLFLAKEDSVILSLLRRLLGPMMGLLRTNFIILRPDSEDVIGEFKRKFTILDRYVLDMTGDPQRLMDRRVALALGVMLDTGERR